MQFHSGRVVVGDLVEAILAQESGTVGAEPPHRHPLGSAGCGGGFRRTFQALRLGAIGRSAGARQLDEGPGARLQRALQRRGCRNAPLGGHVAPGQQPGEGGDDQHHDDRHDERGEAAVGDETHEIGLGHDDQDDPVATGQHAHRLGRDDDAPVAEIEHLAAIALDPQPVVGAYQHGIAQLIEHRRLHVGLVGRQPVVAGIGNDAAGPIDDQGLAADADAELLQEGTERGELDIDTQHALQLAVGVEVGDREGDAGLLQREEQVGVGPERLLRLLRALVPGTRARIESVVRDLLGGDDLALGVAPDPGHAMPAVAAVDRLGVEAALRIAQHVQEVALGIGIAECRGRVDPAQRMQGEQLDLRTAFEHAAAGRRGVGKLEELLGRRQIGMRLDGDPPVDRRDQVVAERHGAAAVAIVDVVRDDRDQHDHHDDAHHRQAVTQRHAQARLAAAGRGSRQGRQNGRVDALLG